MLLAPRGQKSVFIALQHYSALLGTVSLYIKHKRKDCETPVTESVQIGGTHKKKVSGNGVSPPRPIIFLVHLPQIDGQFGPPKSA